MRTLRAEAVGDQRARLHRRAHAAVPLLLLPVPLRRVALLLITPVPLLAVRVLAIPLLLPVRILAVLQVLAVHDQRARTRLLLLLLLLWLLPLLRVARIRLSGSLSPPIRPSGYWFQPWCIAC